MCLSGGIGRRTGLKILRDSTLVSVQVRPQAPFWRNTQVWLKGPVLKTGRSCKRRRGSNPFSSANLIYIAGWSSSVARWAHNPKVRGSNPLPATNGLVVQWLTRLPVTQKIAGSIPVETAIFFGSVAQSVEQGTENPCVDGSIPFGATIKLLSKRSFPFI